MLVREVAHGKKRWVVIWFDATKAPGKAGRRKANCAKGDHADALDAAELSPEQRAALANGATNPALRRRLLTCYRDLERARVGDAARLKGKVPRLDTPLAKVISDYLALLKYRVDIHQGRPAAPPSGSLDLWRAKVREKPLAPRAEYDIRRVLIRYRDWLPAGATTGNLTARAVARFMNHAQHEGGKRRGARTMNKIRAYLAAFYAAFTRDTASELFRVDTLAIFRDHVESLPTKRVDVVAYSAPSVVAFMDAAEMDAMPGQVAEVRRPRNGRVEVFSQEIVTSGPVLEQALLYLCTGLRRDEGLSLEWSSVDLERGILTVRGDASKTSTRYVPLSGDPQGDVAPRFLDLLRTWRERDPAAKYVLPANGKDGRPSYPRTAWRRVRRKAGLDGFAPQGCRRTFESALACAGVPSTLSAFWLGHSPQVAARHYLAYAFGRLPGSTAEEALGLVPFIERAIERAREQRPFRVVAGRAQA